MNKTPIHNAARRAAEKIWRAGYDLTTQEQMAREISAEYAPLVQCLRDMLADSAKYPQLKLHERHELRITKALEAIEK